MTSERVYCKDCERFAGQNCVASKIHTLSTNQPTGLKTKEDYLVSDDDVQRLREVILSQGWVDRSLYIIRHEAHSYMRGGGLCAGWICNIYNKNGDCKYFKQKPLKVGGVSVVSKWSFAGIFSFARTQFDKYFLQKRVVSKKEIEYEQAKVELEKSKDELEKYRQGAKDEIEEVLND